MVFPYLADTEENFELGTVDPLVWDGTAVDTQSKAAVRHYTWMARQGFVREVPYTGAYVWHIDLSLGTADVYLESTAWATALDGSLATRLAFLLTGMTMAEGDRFTLFALQSAGPVSQGTLGVRMEGGDLQLVLSQAGASPLVAASLSQDTWHTIQQVAAIDSGGGDGSVQLLLDGYPVGTLTGLTQAAITQVRLGALGLDAGTTAGHLFFDHVLADEALMSWGVRNQPFACVTRSGHVRVGPGQLASVRLLDSGDATARLHLYDTDRGDTSRPLIIPPMQYNDNWQWELGTAALTRFQHGCYALLEGNDAQAYLSFHESCLAPGGVANAAFIRR